MDKTSTMKPLLRCVACSEESRDKMTVLLVQEDYEILLALLKFKEKIKKTEESRWSCQSGKNFVCLEHLEQLKALRLQILTNITVNINFSTSTTMILSFLKNNLSAKYEFLTKQQLLKIILRENFGVNDPNFHLIFTRSMCDSVDQMKTIYEKLWMFIEEESTKFDGKDPLNDGLRTLKNQIVRQIRLIEDDNPLHPPSSLSVASSSSLSSHIQVHNYNTIEDDTSKEDKKDRKRLYLSMGPSKMSDHRSEAVEPVNKKILTNNLNPRSVGIKMNSQGKLILINRKIIFHFDDVYEMIGAKSKSEVTNVLNLLERDGLVHRTNRNELNYFIKEVRPSRIKNIDQYGLKISFYLELWNDDRSVEQVRNFEAKFSSLELRSEISDLIKYVKSSSQFCERSANFGRPQQRQQAVNLPTITSNCVESIVKEEVTN